MNQTGLKSDNFCGFNQATGPFFWTNDPIQNNVQYSVGEVGTPAGLGIHTPAEVIQVSNLLTGRGRYLSSCVPPAPNLPSKNGFDSDASINNNGPELNVQGLSKPGTEMQMTPGAIFKREKFNDFIKNEEQKQHREEMTDYSDKMSDASGQVYRPKKTDKSSFLIASNTRMVGAAKDLSHIDLQGGFSGNIGNLFTNPQDLTHIIERNALQRGGLDQNQMIKQAHYFTNNMEQFAKNMYDYDFNLKKAKNTCNRIRRPYDISYPFGLETNMQTGQPIMQQRESQHFTPGDVASQGKDTPRFEQDLRLRFNNNAGYLNGGCNDISFLGNNLMCQETDNYLTGINNFNFGNQLPPPGIVS